MTLKEKAIAAALSLCLQLSQVHGPSLTLPDEEQRSLYFAQLRAVGNFELVHHGASDCQIATPTLQEMKKVDELNAFPIRAICDGKVTATAIVQFQELNFGGTI